MSLSCLSRSSEIVVRASSWRILTGVHHAVRSSDKPKVYSRESGWYIAARPKAASDVKYPLYISFRESTDARSTSRHECDESSSKPQFPDTISVPRVRQGNVGRDRRNRTHESSGLRLVQSSRTCRRGRAAGRPIASGVSASRHRARPRANARSIRLSPGLVIHPIVTIER